MIKENVERNTIIYELWSNGRTIDEIAFDTGIPRSTVGYYVRKFNKKAKRGEPIILPHNVEEPNLGILAQQAINKQILTEKLNQLLIEGDLDSAYKFLMIMKLNRELQRELSPTKEEGAAVFKLLGNTKISS